MSEVNSHLAQLSQAATLGRPGVSHPLFPRHAGTETSEAHESTHLDRATSLSRRTRWPEMPRGAITLHATERAPVLWIPRTPTSATDLLPAPTAITLSSRSTISHSPGYPRFPTITASQSGLYLRRTRTAGHPPASETLLLIKVVTA